MLVTRKIEIESSSLAPLLDPTSIALLAIARPACRTHVNSAARAHSRIGTKLGLPQKQATRIQIGMKLVGQPEEVQDPSCPFPFLLTF